MPVAVIACQCGSSDSMARNFLKRVGYQNWLDVPIHRGKEKSRSFLNQLPPVPEKEMLANFLNNASKWVVIIGYDEQTMKWSDISHNAPKSTIEAEFIVQNFKFA